MIKFRFRGLLWKKRLTQQDISIMTGIRPGTINAYFHGFAKRINVKDLDIICKTLNCSLLDVIEYVPDKKK